VASIDNAAASRGIGGDLVVPSTTKTSRGGSHRRFKEIGVQMDAVSEKMHRLVDKA
jgi:hypothetical protein